MMKVCSTQFVLDHRSQIGNLNTNLLSTGTFLYRHYKEALSLISTLSAELAEIQTQLHITNDDFEGYLQDEWTYLQSLQTEPPHETLQYQYVECLMDLDKHRYLSVYSYYINLNSSERNAHDVAQQALRKLLSAHPPPHGLHKLLVKANCNIRTALGTLERTEQRTVQLENQLEVRDRWDPSSEEYKAVRQGLAQRQYRSALDELERLVVQRLFELAKLNISGTGESHSGLSTVH